MMTDVHALFVSYQKKIAKAGAGNLRNITQFAEWLAEVDAAAKEVVAALRSEADGLRDELRRKDDEISALRRDIEARQKP